MDDFNLNSPTCVVGTNLTESYTANAIEFSSLNVPIDDIIPTCSNTELCNTGQKNSPFNSSNAANNDVTANVFHSKSTATEYFINQSDQIAPATGELPLPTINTNKKNIKNIKVFSQKRTQPLTSSQNQTQTQPLTSTQNQYNGAVEFSQSDPNVNFWNALGFISFLITFELKLLYLKICQLEL